MLQTLESLLRINPQTGQIEVAIKDKVSYTNNPEPRRRHARHPDTYSPNAQSVLKSLILALAMTKPARKSHVRSVCKQS